MLHLHFLTVYIILKSFVQSIKHLNACMCFESTQQDKRLNLKFKQQEVADSLNGIRMLYAIQNYIFLFSVILDVCLASFQDDCCYGLLFICLGVFGGVFKSKEITSCFSFLNIHASALNWLIKQYDHHYCGT